jgi:hypothetical protein
MLCYFAHRRVELRAKSALSPRSPSPPYEATAQCRIGFQSVSWPTGTIRPPLPLPSACLALIGPTHPRGLCYFELMLLCFPGSREMPHQAADFFAKPRSIPPKGWKPMLLCYPARRVTGKKRLVTAFPVPPVTRPRCNVGYATLLFGASSAIYTGKD